MIWKLRAIHIGILFSGTIYETKETPLSLRCMCRTQIRKTLIECHSIPSATSQDYVYKPSIVSAIHGLSLPEKLNEYLVYGGQLTEISLSEPSGYTTLYDDIDHFRERLNSLSLVYFYSKFKINVLANH